MTHQSDQKIYALRRRVDILRQQVLYPLDGTTDERLLMELSKAESRLAELESTHPIPKGQGLLLDNRTEDSAEGGQLMGAETTGLEIVANLRQEQVPTGIIHLLERDQHPLVSYDLKYTGGEYMRVQVTSWVEGYSAEAVDTIELTYKNREGRIKQLPTFFPERLRSLTELTRATFHILVKNLDGGVELHQTFPIWLLARTSAYLAVRDPGEDRMLDLRPYLASWVTPNAPAVMDLLRKAAELHPEKQIVGYQSDAEEVRKQVTSIFEALKAEGLTYVNSLVSLGAGQGVISQRVRLPREALAYRSANCIDGTVLMASILEFASLNPAIVLVPGHAFLGWQKSQEGEEDPKNWDYLETTLIGSAEFDVANAQGRLVAARYWQQAQQPGREAEFYRLSLQEARTTHGVLPME